MVALLHILPLSTESGTFAHNLSPLNTVSSPLPVSSSLAVDLPLVDSLSQLSTYPLSQNSTKSLPQTSSHSMTTHSKNNILKTKRHYHTTSKHHLFASVEPIYVTQAIKFAEWHHAMSDELTTLLCNWTWELVPHSPSQNEVGYKCFFFWIKQHPDGSNSKYKARLVAKGFHQHPNIDFHDTF